MVNRNGVLLYKSEFLPEKQGEVAKEMQIRFRTIGDMTSQELKNLMPIL